jgi:hypothetical protein
MFSLLNSYQNKLDGYERWAQRGRAWVVERVRTRVEDQVRALNASSKAAFESNNRQLDSMNERLLRLESSVARTEARVERTEANVQNILVLLQTAAAVAPAAAAGNNNAPEAAARAPEAATQGKLFCCSTLVALYLLYFTNSILLAVAGPTGPPLRELQNVLRATPCLPAFNTRMPRTFVLLLADWQNRGLEEFRNVVFQDSSALTQAYAKRKYLVDSLPVVSTASAPSC